MDNPKQDPQQPQSKPDQKPSAPPRRGRGRLFFLLLLLIAAAVWFGLRIERGARQAQAVKKIESLGGYVVYDYQGGRATEPQGMPWARKVLGDQYFVTIVTAHVTAPAPADLEQLATDLQPVAVETLYLSSGEQGDKIVKPLGRLTGLKRLFVSDKFLTADGVKQLQQALPHTQVKPN